jgi:hypothetical protein
MKKTNESLVSSQGTDFGDIEMKPILREALRVLPVSPRMNVILNFYKMYPRR